MEQPAEVAETIFRSVAPDECSCLTEVAQEHVPNRGYDYDEEFEFGLELIL